jgi:putative sigma-54 modulation protein
LWRCQGGQQLSGGAHRSDQLEISIEKDGKMNVEITGRHIEITPAIRSYVLKRLNKFDRLFGDGVSFHVVIDVEKERHTVEILLKSRLLDLTGKVVTDDMYTSGVRAIDKLERQAIKNKARLTEPKRQKAKTKSVKEKSGVSVSRPASTPKRPGIVLEEEEVPGRPMSVEDALAELEQSEYKFVAFRNMESGSLSVIYRRRDGSIGLIQE